MQLPPWKDPHPPNRSLKTTSMDATHCHGLARMLSVVLVTFVATSPTLRAKERSTLVFSDPSVAEDTVLESSPASTAKKRSAAGSLVVVPERKPQPISQPKRVRAAASKSLPRPTTSARGPTRERKKLEPLTANELTARPLPKPAAPRQVDQPAAKPVAAKPDYVQPVSHAISRSKQEVEETTDAGAELLVEAHELSLHAEEPQDFVELVALCRSAKRLGVEGDQLDFANTLMAWALNRRGQFHADHGEQEEADQAFEQALKLEPHNWRALHNRGVSYAQAGKFAEALDDFSQVIEINPLFAKAFANRATLYCQSGDLEIALDDYHRACRLDPKMLVAQIGLGRTCHLLGRREEALDAFNRAELTQAG